MPVMRTPDVVRTIHLRGALLTWASLPVLIALSWTVQTTLRATQTPKPGAAQAKTEKKLDTSTRVVAPNLSAQLAKFKIHPWLEDGSGLSRRDWTTPREVVVTLQHMASNPDFVNSLAVAGSTGTLAGRMGGTAAGSASTAKALGCPPHCRISHILR